uniref:Uncharacterized protein n=1 Tax=Arundo donax TaxID=35708 RepID=A0A0A9DA43_ARUDO
MLCSPCRTPYHIQLVVFVILDPSTGQTPCRKPALPPSSPPGLRPRPRRRPACSSPGPGTNPCSSDPSSLLQSLHPDEAVLFFFMALSCKSWPGSSGNMLCLSPCTYRKYELKGIRHLFISIYIHIYMYGSSGIKFLSILLSEDLTKIRCFE